MADDSRDPTRERSTELDGAMAPASSNYKVLGYNTTGSGTTYGVLGQVDSTDGYGLYTPDDAKLEGTLDTAETDFVVETGTTDVRAAQNVVAGHASNSASGTVGAVIGGGGYDDGSDPGPNTVTGYFGTVAGGSSNTASGDYATVGGGVDNTASGDDATVSGGQSNVAKGATATIGGGNDNVASGQDSTVCGGAVNTASGRFTTASGGLGSDATADYATVGGGNGNTASGESATVPGGDGNTASGNYSFAAGRNAATSGYEGTFVWADSTNSTVASSKSDSFVVEAGGGVGIGTNGPVTQFHVLDEVSNSSNDVVSDHVGLLEDPLDTDTNSLLALRTGYTGNPGNNTNFITFFNGNDSAYGAIEGAASDGVTLDTSAADYAEYMPLVDPEETIEPADVVGVVDGAVTKRTGEADTALVVSDRPVVSGNSPGQTPDDRQGYEVCAFVGQVPVKVRGPVETGDLIVPSGREDGTAEALATEAFSPGDGPLVGRAWEGDDSETVSEVTVAVGIETGEALAETVARQQTEIDALRAENERLRRENESLRDRVATIETHVGLDGSAPASADD